MNPISGRDAALISCVISCGPGHWYLSQGLAHVESVSTKIFFLLHELCQGERDIINSGGSKPSPVRRIRAVHKATHRLQILFPHSWHY